jgi:hypothetical protein
MTETLAEKPARHVAAALRRLRVMKPCASRARLRIGSCAMKPAASSAHFDSAISGKRSPACSGSASLPRPKAITPTSASAGDRARLWRPIVLGEPLGRGVMAHVAPLSFDGGHRPVTAHQPTPSLATAWKSPPSRPGVSGRDGAGGCKARLTKCESGRIVKALGLSSLKIQ